MENDKTITLVIETKLKITVPASLNDAQQHSIINDLGGSLPSSVMTEAIKAALKNNEDWSHEQVVSGELLIETNSFSVEPKKPSCPHCGDDLTLENSVIRDYVNKSSDEDAEGVSAYGHYEGEDLEFVNDSFDGFGGGDFDLLDDSDKCDSCNGQL
jgi:hypothetical protein